MKLIYRDTCTSGDTCPALYEDETRFVVQGHLVDAEAEGIKLGPGEIAISVPKSVLNSLRK